MDQRRPAPAQDLLAYVWSAVALIANSDRLGPHIESEPAMAARLSAPELLSLASAGWAGSQAAAATGAGVTGRSAVPEPGTADDSRGLFSTSDAAIPLLVAILIFAALLASLALTVKRELGLPRRRVL